MAIHSLIYLLVLLGSLFFTPSLADIRYTSIANQNFMLLDIFYFTGNGRLELNVSQINISLPSSIDANTFNLSLSGFFIAPSDEVVNGQGRNCFLDSSVSVALNKSVNILYTLEEIKGRESFDFAFDVEHPDEVELFFQNCVSDINIFMHVRSATYNLLDQTSDRRSYLSASKNYVLGFRFVFVFLYLLQAGIWFYAQFNKRSHITIYVLVMLCTKLISLLFELVDGYYLKHWGYAQGWSIFFTLTSSLLKRASITTMAVISSGWSEQSMNKMFFKIIVFLHTITAIWSVVILKSGPCSCECYIRMFFYNLWDFCLTQFTILLPSVFVKIHLVMGGQALGKAAVNLKKARKLSTLVGVSLIYVVFLHILTFIFEGLGFILFFKQKWGVVLLPESAILAFYTFISYKLWPETSSQIIRVSEDEEKAAAEDMYSLSHMINFF